METIKAVVQQIVFSNPDNGYSVLQVDVEDMGWQTVVGTFVEVGVGSTLVIDGDWRNDKKYGRQFAAVSWHEELPATLLGMEKYLGSGLIQGIGRTHARNIVAHFGLQTFDVIEKHPERLADVEGIGKKRIEKIKASWQKQRGVKDVMVFLQGHGVSPAYAVKIYKEYGKDSIQKVKENPYCLADDIFGIGFKMADAIASTLGYGKNDPRRLRAGILYTLNLLATDGHCFAESGQLTKAATELLQADGQPLGEALRGMIADNSLIIDGEAIYLPMYYYAECGVANKLRTLMGSE